MFTTKLTGFQEHSTPTGLQFMKMQLDVYVRSSRLSMAVRQCLGISSENESMFVKLCELPEYIRTSQETVVQNTSVSGTLRRHATSDCPSLHQSTTCWENVDAQELIRKWREWYEEITHRNPDAWRDLFECKFESSAERTEFKAKTFGMRYGISNAEKDILEHRFHVGTNRSIDALESRCLGSKPDTFWLDEYFKI